MTSGFPELRAGQLGVRLAETDAERDAAEALRYRVFYEEMGAHPSAEAKATRRDRDRFDAVADHLLVLDHADPDHPAVVGTYRLIRRDAAARAGGFYSADEYDLAPLLAQPGGLLELGRSCVDAAWRNRAAMQVMWQGIAAYIFHNHIDLMFGVGSLHGTDPDALAPALTYLAEHHLAPPELRPRALPGRYVEMRRRPAGTVTPRQGLALLPPLIKGYLLRGGFTGDGAVIDDQFKTVDVAIVVKTALVTEKYYRHYERQTDGTA